MLFLLTDSPQKLFNNSLLCKPEVFSATKHFVFLLKTQKTGTAAVNPQHLRVEVAD